MFGPNPTMVSKEGSLRSSPSKKNRLKWLKSQPGQAFFVIGGQVFDRNDAPLVVPVEVSPHASLADNLGQAEVVVHLIPAGRHPLQPVGIVDSNLARRGVNHDGLDSL